MKVILLGEYPPLVEEELKRFHLTYEKVKTEALSNLSKEVEAVLVGDGVCLPDCFFEASHQVKVIASIKEGADNINLKQATRVGLPVLAPNQGLAYSIADFIFMRILNLARLYAYQGSPFELKGKKIGILGWNETAAQLAIRAKAFGMKIAVCATRLREGHASLYQATLEDKIELFATSDFVVVLLPYGERSGNILNKDIFRLMRPEASLLYFTDLRLVNFDDMVRGVSWGDYHHLAIDFSRADERYYHQVKDLPHVLATVAEAGNTKEAELATVKEIVKDLARSLLGERVKSAINVPRLPLNTQRENYSEFFTFLGELSSARFQALPKRIELIYEGNMSIKLDEILLAHDYFLGLAKGLGDSSINHINSRLWAEERGVELAFFKGDSHGAESFVLRLFHQGKIYEIAARMLGEHWQILGWDDYHFIAEPTRHLLILPHSNRPGIVGKVGSLLGERKINIGGMVLGHSPSDYNRAMMWIRLDSAPSGDLMDAFREMPEILEATYIYSECAKGMENHVRHQTDKRR